MSTTNDTSLPADSSSIRAMALRESEVLDRQELSWASAAALVQSASAPLSSFTAYFHGLRRHWALATVLGLFLAAAAMVGVWYGYGAQFESIAYLRVSSQEPKIVSSFKTAEGPRADLASEFDIYKGTQMQLLRSRFVLHAALRRPEVRKFRIDERKYDPVGWVADKLEVTYPGKAEIMEVRFVSRDAEEAATLVGAVVDCYLNDVVNVVRKEKENRLNDLESLYSKKETEVRQQRGVLKKLAEEFGASDPKALSMRQTMALGQLDLYERQHMLMAFELRSKKADLDSANSQLKTIAELEINPQEVDALARTDIVGKDIAADLAWRRLYLADMESTIVQGDKSKMAQRQRTELKKVQDQYEELRKDLQEMVRAKIEAEIQRDKIKLEPQLAALAEQEQQYAQDVANKRAEAEKLSGSSIELAMESTRLDQLDQMLKDIGKERDELKVEINAAPRINLIQPAEVPTYQHFLSLRIALTVLAAMAGFCLPIGLIVWWDMRARRVNTPSEVSKGLGLSVIGSVPLVPARAVRHLEGTSKWQLRLSESVDGIVARLLRRASMEHAHVILVSSATRGEGKTTLATQLAMSLARNGRRTALVDFDLRRPALAAAFDLPLEPGLSDVLRGQADLAQLVHRTAIDENLSVATAGIWDRVALAALANGGAAPIFEKLRAQFEFVVADASPILPVADTRFVSQHVDAVILSVFRDISQMPKVQAACEILDAFGVRTLEAVVIGPNENLRDKDLE